MTKKKFKVVDLYEGKEVIGYADDMAEIKKLARHWLTEVAEEAAIYYYPLDERLGKYDTSKAKFLKTF